MIKHIVFTRFENKSCIETAVSLLRSLEGKIDGLSSIEVGVDTEHSAKSFDYAAIMVFRDKTAQDFFDTHPEHQKVQAFIRQQKREVVKVDYLIPD